jgi:hypothetical protein
MECTRFKRIIAKQTACPWNDAKGQSSAKEAFDRLFNLKWTPPGRGLWVMGTPLVNVPAQLSRIAKLRVRVNC